MAQIIPKKHDREIRRAERRIAKEARKEARRDGADKPTKQQPPAAA